MRNDVEPEPGSPTVEDADTVSDAEEADRAGPEPGRGGVARWIRLLLALTTLAVALLGSHPRVGVTVDSGEYLAVGEGLNDGEGLTMSYLSYDELYPVEADALDE